MTGQPSRYGHLIRMALLFAAGISTFLILRAALMPEGFGVYGHYRSGALDDNRQPPLRFAGQGACLECHGEIGQVRAVGAHATVACESCHGALAAHAANPGEARVVPPDARAVCLTCHTANKSKPRDFPQIVASDHAPEGTCSACHRPHSPKVS